MGALAPLPTPDELEAGLEHIRQSPKNNGRLELIVCRPETGERQVLEEATLDLTDGLLGDNWKVRGSSKTTDGSAHPERQITIVNARAIGVVARERDRWPLAGDQLFIDLDLSQQNLPPGSRLTIGSVVLEITAPPHRGCSKFVSRFGADAMKFVNSPLGQELNLRGIHAKVIQAGVVRVKDPVVKL
jgi:hypothetical protein